MATQQILPVGTNSFSELLKYNGNSLLMIVQDFWPTMVTSLIWFMLAVVAWMVVRFCMTTATSRREDYRPEERHSSSSRSRSRSRY